MVIEIESIYGNKLLHGKKKEFEQIKCALTDNSEMISMEEFLNGILFRFGYEELPYDESVEVDYVLDLDIGKIYKPKY